MKVLTKNATEKELAVLKVVEQVISKYEVPAFTDTIMIEQGAVPHSHPVLTLNTRKEDELNNLKTLVHEQFHWFAHENETYDECISYLKKYPDLGDCNKTGTYPNSFWEHLIVCWNTRNYLESNLSAEEVEELYSEWLAYPLTEEFVKENFDELKGELEKFGMVYRR